MFLQNLLENLQILLLLLGKFYCYLGKCNHVGAIPFALQNFNRKKFVGPLTCTSQLAK